VIPGLTKTRLHKDSIRLVYRAKIQLRTPLDPDPEPDASSLDAKAAASEDHACPTVLCDLAPS
jgi:hypothetical protein